MGRGAGDEPSVDRIGADTAALDSEFVGTGLKSGVFGGEVTACAPAGAGSGAGVGAKAAGATGVGLLGSVSEGSRRASARAGNVRPTLNTTTRPAGFDDMCR